MKRAAFFAAIFATGCLPQVGPPVGTGGEGGSGGGAGGPGGGGGGAIAASCTNGQRDGDETDLDCGGTCAGCGAGRLCLAPPDCASGVCSASGRCAAPADPCPAVFAGCTSFVDATDGGDPRVIRFPIGANRYSPPCVRVRLGQSVRFEGGDFKEHPLDQACGPVRSAVGASNGTAATFVMDRALGVFGYYCGMHGTAGGSGMAGAIEVVR